MTLQVNEGMLQSIHEPRKLTSGAKIVSEPHATSDRLPNSVSRSTIRYPILHPPKAFFFEKSQHVPKVFNGT